MRCNICCVCHVNKSKSPKSLMRMFGPSGNPTAENLLGVIGILQEDAGVRLRVRAVADAA